jgi:poly-gamma-glutamate synthesis protein (capsule biosynthesis protein)
MQPSIPAVTAFSPKGKIIVALLRFLLRLLHFWFGSKWRKPPPFFREDPRHYTKMDLLFFAYKYYFRPPLESENKEEVERFFEDHPIDFPCRKNPVAPIATVSLTAAGDLMPYEWIQKPFCQNLWTDIADDFFSSDLSFANLETPIDISRPASLVPEVMLSDMDFNANEEMFDLFTAQNMAEILPIAPPSPNGVLRAVSKPFFRFDVLSTANNHSLDMGEAGVYQTIDFLEAKGIAFTGTARNQSERANFPIIERHGIRLAFIAYTFSMNQYTNPPDKDWLVNHLEVNQADVDLSPLKADVRHAKTRGADFVLLSLHFGNAYQAYPGAHIVQVARRLFEETGVDVILGGHPHNIQPMALYPFVCPFTGVSKQGFVLFSFSDFVAYDIFNGCHLSVYLKMDISKMPIPETDMTQTVLTYVEAVPVYACGVYRSARDRELRLLDARKWLSKIEAGERPAFMTDWHVQELTALMTFYERYFAKNINQ